MYSIKMKENPSSIRLLLSRIGATSYSVFTFLDLHIYSLGRLMNENLHLSQF